MNVFNRIVVVLLLMIGIVFWIGASLLVVFFPVIDKSWMRGLGETLITLSSAQSFQLAFVAVFALLAVVLVALQLLLLWAEIVPGGPSSIKVEDVNGTVTLVPVASIVGRIKAAALTVPDVAHPTAKVASKKGGVAIALRVTVPHMVPIAPKSAELNQVVRQAVEGELGLAITRLDVDLKLDPKMPVSTPAPAPAPAVPVYDAPRAEPDQAAGDAERP